MKNIWKQKTEFILIAPNYLLLGAVHKKLGACAGQQPPSESAGSEELLQCITCKTSSRAKLISISQAAYTHRPEQQNYRKAWDVSSVFAYSLRSLSVHARHSVTFTSSSLRFKPVRDFSWLLLWYEFKNPTSAHSRAIIYKIFRNLTFPWVQGHSKSSETFSRSTYGVNFKMLVLEARWGDNNTQSAFYSWGIK